MRLGPGRQARQRVADRGPVRQVGGLNDLDVPRHRVGRVGVVGLADEDDRRVGEVEWVDETGALSTIELGAGARDRRDVLGCLVVLAGADLAQRVLDAAQAGLQRGDAGALEEGVRGGGGERRVGRRQLAHGRGDRRLQGGAPCGGHCAGVAGERHVMAQRGQERVGRGKRRLLVACPGPGGDVGPHRRHQQGGTQRDDGSEEPASPSSPARVSHSRPPHSSSSPRPIAAP